MGELSGKMTEINSNESPLREVQKVLTSMMVTIDTICKENDIPYFLSDGSLLGCIRHGGFIPWDDDIDIGMLRKDYNKFMKVIKTNLPSIYKVETYKLHIHRKHNWLKIMYLDDFEWVGKDGDTRKGTSIDIFPFDYVQGVDNISPAGKIFNRLSRLMYPKKINNPKDFIASMVIRAKLYNFYCPFNKETDTITYGIETPFYGSAFFTKDEIFPLKTGTFENQQFNIPGNPDHFLTTVYGDYMKIPEEADRQIHMANLKVIDKDKLQL